MNYTHLIVNGANLSIYEHVTHFVPNIRQKAECVSCHSAVFIFSYLVFTRICFRLIVLNRMIDRNGLHPLHGLTLPFVITESIMKGSKNKQCNRQQLTIDLHSSKTISLLQVYMKQCRYMIV